MTPQPRDRVRWQRTRVIEGVVEEITSDGLRIRAEDGRLHLCQVEDATVEVLERADDPSKDPIGTVRKGAKASPVVRSRVISDDQYPWKSVMYKVAYSHDEVAGWEVIGAVPGTPAAEAAESAKIMDTSQRITPRLSVRVPNEPHGPAAGVLQLVREELTQGHALAAVNLLKRATGWSLDEAREYVESMSEYQAHLSEHGRTEVDPAEANRMRAMRFDKQPEVQISDEDRALIASVLEERMGEYFRDTGYGYRLNTDHLAGVVADIVYAVRVQDRKRGDCG